MYVPDSKHEHGLIYLFFFLKVFLSNIQHFDLQSFFQIKPGGANTQSVLVTCLTFSTFRPACSD